MNSTDLEVGALFTTNGKDVWKLRTFCTSPTCTLENLDNPKKKYSESFGMNGSTAKRFHRIKMPEIPATGE